jgi:Cu(I)/Ag(I) efflux system membrane fusion protein
MKSLKKISWSMLKITFVVLIAFVLGYLARGWRDSSQPDIEHIHAVQAQDKGQMWTCSMHPQIHQPKPGKCPICFMDLVPVSDETAATDGNERQISFSPEAVKLMEIQTTQVERKFVEAQINMVGKVDYDESAVKYITAWAPGRIDRLYVDFTGIQVKKGDHMVYLYSPELISAQAELLQAIDAQKKIGPESSELIRRSTSANLDAVRERLKLLGLEDTQIENIQKTNQPADHVTIYAPIGGIVIEKMVNEGMYVETGTKIYTIADLSSLWVQLDAYESDMAWIRYGQAVEFSVEACPGELFEGRISFIAPTVDPMTRTIKVRLNVSNAEGKLKPDMFVRAIVRSQIASGGKVMAADMAGKWICPMHPSVVKDNAGQCDICQMDTVTTESLGYVAVGAGEQGPLVIPVTAALITGTRAVVYVKKPDTEKPVFEGREIVLGPRAGDYYLVEEGLVEGEVVVTNGNFKIDSALQIQAKPSMMNPQGQKMPAGHEGHKM